MNIEIKQTPSDASVVRTVVNIYNSSGALVCQTKIESPLTQKFFRFHGAPGRYSYNQEWFNIGGNSFKTDLESFEIVAGAEPTTQEPVTTTQEPVTTTQEPVTTTQEPANGPQGQDGSNGSDEEDESNGSDEEDESNGSDEEDESNGSDEEIVDSQGNSDKGPDIDVALTPLATEIGLSKQQIKLLSQNKMKTVGDVQRYVAKHGSLEPAKGIAKQHSDSIMTILNIVPPA